MLAQFPNWNQTDIHFSLHTKKNIFTFTQSPIKSRTHIRVQQTPNMPTNIRGRYSSALRSVR